MLAGSVNQGLAGAVKTNPINPQDFLSKAGVTSLPQATPANRINIPGMIEQPKSTPSGTEIVGKVEMMPDLIPIPDDLRKFVPEEAWPSASGPDLIPTATPDGGNPTAIPNWEPAKPTLTAGVQLHTIEDIWNSLEEIKSLLRSKYKSKSKSKKSTKKRYKYEGIKIPVRSSTTNSYSEMVPGSGDTKTTTPGTSAQDS